MCGLAGLVIGKKVRSIDDLNEIRDEFSSLMVATQIRGRHATGAFVVNKSGVTYHKAALSADKMVRTDSWKKLMSAITADTTAVVGHVRYATKGDPSENSNNHPILNGPIIGVHNGVITNDCEICEEYPYEEEVDSAAIFSLFAGVAEKSRLSTAKISAALPYLNGSFAVIAADNRRRDSIFVMRDSTNPLVFHKDAERKLLWLSSTGAIMRDGLHNRRIVTTMFPAYSVARLSRAHAGKSPVKVSKWYEPAEFIEINDVPQKAGAFSTAGLWDDEFGMDPVSPKKNPLKVSIPTRITDIKNNASQVAAHKAFYAYQKGGGDKRQSQWLFDEFLPSLE